MLSREDYEFLARLMRELARRSPAKRNLYWRLYSELMAKSEGQAEVESHQGVEYWREIRFWLVLLLGFAVAGLVAALASK